MSLSTNRRIVGAAAVTGLIAAGVAGVTTVAAGTASAAGCTQKSTQTQGGPLSTYTYSKESPATAAAGANVTYTLTFSATSPGNPYINAISDHAPAGFPQPTVKVTAYHLGLGTQTEAVQPIANGTDTWRVANAGWFVDAGNPLVVQYTYKVPSSYAIGQQITSGGVGVSGTVNYSREMPGLTSCFTVRAPNAGEATKGSLDASGFGSSSNGPASGGIIPDLISGLGGS